MNVNGHIPRRQFLQLSAGIAASAGLPRNIFDALDFGAKGDGSTLNTEALQRAIDQAAAAGGGTVWVPSGEFLTGGLVLRSRVTLHLEAGAILRGSTRVEDYQYHPGRPRKETQTAAIFSSQSMRTTSRSQVRASSMAAVPRFGPGKVGRLLLQTISGAM